MELVFYRGLNCRLACIVSIAKTLGVNYTDAFSTLWSETHFVDDAMYNVYASKNVYTNLEAIGVAIQHLYSNDKTIEEFAAQIPDGSSLIVGMDSFNIPWHPVFNNFHGPHFICARKESAHSLLCFDPVYDKINIRMSTSDILPFAYEVCLVYRANASEHCVSIKREAESVLDVHPRTKDSILNEMQRCVGDGRRNTTLLLKQINAMIDNRYLFRQFIHSSVLASGECRAFFSQAFLSKWEAVRYGLYKASILKDNKAIIDEVCGLFANLINEEIIMAQAIVTS